MISEQDARERAIAFLSNRKESFGSVVAVRSISPRAIFERAPYPLSAAEIKASKMPDYWVVELTCPNDPTGMSPSGIMVTVDDAGQAEIVIGL